MRYLKLTFFLAAFLIFFLPKAAQAVSEKQVVIVNPIRGSDFWTHPQNILDTPKKEYEVISQSGLPASWLVRFDALGNPEVVNFLKSLNAKQETGLFLEITPALTQAAGVSYNQSANWHYPRSVFLVGYTPSVRQKLIDAAFRKYKEVLGVYPKSVGAWWIDAYSLGYMGDKYGIAANLDVADQYSTDQYQIWGQYWSTPFYPSKSNALVPAGSPDQKIGVVTLQWATRDPFNAYGNGVGDSTYSVQANDYLLHKLDSQYFVKLLNIYPQVTVGLENDFSWDSFGPEYQNQINVLVQRQKAGSLSVQTMSGFAAYYQKLYPDISPHVLIKADDPLGSEGKVVWYQNSRYRVGWFYGPYGSVIRDLRLFNDSIKESCFTNSCQELNLATAVSKALDDVTFNTRWVLDEGKISDLRVIEQENLLELEYINQAGIKRQLKFLPNDISFDGKTQAVSFAILNIITAPEQTVKNLTYPELGQVDYAKVIANSLLDLGKFMLLTTLFFFLPGWVLSRRLLLSIPLGWVVFTLAAFILGYLHLNNLLWGLPVLGGLALKKTGLPKLPSLRLSRPLIAAALLITAGSISWLLTVIKSGIEYPYGLGFWGPNGHDGIWHLALISELQRNFPPQNPVFAGAPLQNYHYFFDLLLARSASLFGMDNQDLLFRFFPLLISLLAGLLMFKVVKKIAGSGKAGFWAAFLLYFGGSFGWIVTFLRDRSLGGESMFWAMQGISTLLNPPFAISIIFLLAGLYIFIDYQHIGKVDWKRTLLIGLLWGTLIEFKAYGGVVLLGGLGILTLERLVFGKDARLIPLFLLNLGISLAVFLPNNLISNSLFVFRPFWFTETMISFRDRLFWPRLGLTLQSGVLWKAVPATMISVAIFIGGNLGTRLFGLFGLRKLTPVSRLLLYMLAISLILPLLFIQKGTNWNTIQFFYYGLLVADILAAVNLAQLSRKWGKTSAAVIILFILLTLPTSYDGLSHYLPARPPARLTTGEMEALQFLAKLPPGTVLTSPFDTLTKKKYLEPVPLMAYDSTGYVAAYSNHPTFLEDTMNLDILGIDYKARLNLQRDFFKINDQSSEILRKQNITYVYLTGGGDHEIDEGRAGVRKIFDNAEAKIYQVL